MRKKILAVAFTVCAATLLLGATPRNQTSFPSQSNSSTTQKDSLGFFQPLEQMERKIESSFNGGQPFIVALDNLVIRTDTISTGNGFQSPSMLRVGYAGAGRGSRFSGLGESVVGRAGTRYAFFVNDRTIVALLSTKQPGMHEVYVLNDGAQKASAFSCTYSGPSAWAGSSEALSLPGELSGCTRLPEGSAESAGRLVDSLRTAKTNITIKAQKAILEAQIGLESQGSTLPNGHVGSQEEFFRPFWESVARLNTITPR